MGALHGISPSRIEKIIFNFREGEEGWTIPEALELCKDSAYLNLNSTFSPEKDEKDNMTLYVKRTGPSKDDFVVEIKDVEPRYQWKKWGTSEEFEETMDIKRYATLEYRWEEDPKITLDPQYVPENAKRKVSRSTLKELGPKLKQDLDKINSQIKGD